MAGVGLVRLGVALGVSLGLGMVGPKLGVLWGDGVVVGVGLGTIGGGERGMDSEGIDRAVSMSTGVRGMGLSRWDLRDGWGWG